MNPLRYVKLFMGLIYIAAGIYFLLNPMSGNQTLAYILAGAILSYGVMRVYLGYQDLYGKK
jgi:uncharacterized membrane protein HdeD (DUF308 family)